MNFDYDILIIGAGPGGIFTAYELCRKNKNLKIGVFESGNPLEKRKCPIDGKKVKSCIHCKTCAIMNGFGGAGAFSDGKYNITNQFGGTLYEFIGRNIVTGGGLSFVTVIPFSSVALYISLIFLVLGLGVGVFGSITAIKNYLKV